MLAAELVGFVKGLDSPLVNLGSSMGSSECSSEEEQEDCAQIEFVHEKII